MGAVGRVVVEGGEERRGVQLFVGYINAVGFQEIRRGWGGGRGASGGNGPGRNTWPVLYERRFGFHNKKKREGSDEGREGAERNNWSIMFQGGWVSGENEGEGKGGGEGKRYAITGWQYEVQGV